MTIEEITEVRDFIKKERSFDAREDSSLLHVLVNVDHTEGDTNYLKLMTHYGGNVELMEQAFLQLCKNDFDFKKMIITVALKELKDVPGFKDALEKTIEKIDEVLSQS